MFKLALVLRYLRKRKITIFPIAGVALGVMALVVVLSVMEGFETDYRRRMHAMMPDMKLQFQDVQGYAGDTEALLKALEGIGQVRAVSPYVEGLGLADVRVPVPGTTYENVQRVYVNFRGFDFAREDKVLGLVKGGYLQYGDDEFSRHPYGAAGAQPAFIAGARLMGRKFEGIRTKTTDWGVVERGNKIRLLTFTLGSYEKSTLVGEVTDVVSSGIYELDAHTLFMPIEWARALMEMAPNGVSGVGIALTDYTPETVAAAKLQVHEAMARLAPGTDYSITTWEAERQTFLTAIMMERRIMAVILFFLLVSSGFSISAILIMIVLEKVRDIGILRAVGASSHGVAAVFLTYGIMIGVIGAAIGLAGGVIFVEKINAVEQFVYTQTGWQPFPPDIYDLPEIPRILNWWTNMYIVLTAVVVSFAASVIPAVRAAWLNPVEAIRYE